MTGWTHEGDMAGEVARQLQAQHLEAIAADGSAFVDQEQVMVADNRRSIFTKISFRWRSSDQMLLDQIRASVDSMTTHLYSDAKAVIDDFYATLRLPEQDPETGVVVRDNQGRIVWQTHRDGTPIERWEQITGQDIEECLMQLTRLKMDIAPRVNELLLEAVFAKHIADDAFQDAYAELVEETIPGRNAYASRKTRQDKYHAYFCYYLWSSAKTFQAEVDNFCRVLERVRHWQIEGDKGGKKTPRI